MTTKFNIGDRVRLTDKAIKQFGDSKFLIDLTSGPGEVQEVVTCKTIDKNIIYYNILFETGRSFNLDEIELEACPILSGDIVELVGFDSVYDGMKVVVDAVVYDKCGEIMAFKVGDYQLSVDSGNYKLLDWKLVKPNE